MEQARLDAERTALRDIQTKGALCTFSPPNVAQTPLEIRIRTVDQVGFLTTVAHIKSRLRAEYPGQPPEALQTISRGLSTLV